MKYLLAKNSQSTVCGSWFQNPSKQHNLRVKVLEKFISSRDGLFKGMKQGRDENTQEDCPTMERWWKRKTRRLPYVCCKEDKKTTLYLLYAADVV